MSVYPKRRVDHRVQAVTPTLFDAAAGASRVIVSMGPLTLPTTPQLTAELVRLAGLSRGNRLGLRRVPRARWRWDPDGLVDEVLEWSECFPGTENLDIAEKLTLLRRTTPTPQGLRVYVAGEHLITDVSHAVVGGVMVVRLWLYLSVCSSHPTPRWTSTTPQRPHLVWMLLRHLALRPQSVVMLAAAGRRRPVAAPCERPSRPSNSEPIASARPRVSEPTSVTNGPPQPMPTTLSAQIDADRRAALQAWRDAHASSCSMAVVLITVLTRAFHTVGIPLAPCVHVVVDASRYDRRLSGYLGNMAVGLNLPFAPPHDPRALQHELAGAMSSGRPLAAMLAISLGELMARRRQADGADGVELQSTGLSTLSFSHLLGLDDMPDGHWIGGFDAHQFTAVSDPVDERGIALLTPKMRDRYDISASFDERFHDPETVRHALDLAASNPVALLTSSTAVDFGEPS
ncbi:hypothetical protein AAFP35_16040 [Gordonia sp. CPCC 206044]|uniref:hypothetical protein n=1 Tax=Gordonia sp. CPCC 206044 TaxID=3140793 RepID=UPI003AF379EC